MFCLHVCPTRKQYLRRPQEGAPGVTAGGELPRGCWDPNQVPCKSSKCSELPGQLPKALRPFVVPAYPLLTSCQSSCGEPTEPSHVLNDSLPASLAAASVAASCEQHSDFLFRSGEDAYHSWFTYCSFPQTDLQARDACFVPGAYYWHMGGTLLPAGWRSKYIAVHTNLAGTQRKMTALV